VAWYSKSTSIYGYDTTELGPHPGEARIAWAKVHARHLFRSGHWSPDASLRAARKAGIVTAARVEHTTSDLNGKGYGGIDRRFVVSEAGVIDMPVSQQENAEWAAQQSADVWESDHA
jgi:hypothetical protein